MHVKSQSCIALFDLLLQQLYGILGQPSYMSTSRLVTPKEMEESFSKFGDVLSTCTFSFLLSIPETLQLR